MNVLYVEDEPALRRAVHYWLERRGFRVHTARSVFGAKRCLRKFAMDGAFIDLWLPDGNGVDLYDWIHEHYPRTAERSVFVTGDVLADAALAGRLAATGRPTLHKPFDLEMLEPFLLQWKEQLSTVRRNPPGHDQRATT